MISKDLNAPLKIAIVVSHPIQHFCPQYVSFAQHENIQLKVFFGSALGYRKYLDENFKHEISWGNLQLDQFDHVFLNGDEVIQADKNLDSASLERELSIYAPDCIIQYGYFQQLQKRAYRWAIKNKVALAYISDSELRQQRNKLKDWIKSILIRRHFSKINYFLTVGDANEEFYAKHGVTANKMLRMHFPIDLQQYETAYSQKGELDQQIRNQYAIEEDAVILLVVGKLVSWKSQDHIIDAMKVLEEQGYTTHLFMLGSGEKQETWIEKSKELKKSKVYFPGFVSIELLPSFYAACDIYLCPAAIEPHSIAISEAIYMGCPVVVSNRSGSYGPEDDVKEAENGRVFPFGDIQFLAAVLKKLIVDEEERRFFSYNSHQRAVIFQQTAHYAIMEKLRVKLSKNREA
jgi:glycosyltransferase involved in cell wall biosynthesis